MAVTFKITINGIRNEVDAFDSRNWVEDYEKWESELMEGNGPGTGTLHYYNMIITAIPGTRTLNVRMNAEYFKRTIKFHQAMRNGEIRFVIFGVWEDGLWRHGIDLRNCDVDFRNLSGDMGMVTFKPEKTSLDHLLST